MRRISILLWLLPVSAVIPFYPWLSKMEKLEERLYESNMYQIVARAQRRSNQSTLAAEWIRLAYHDMATHNVDDGTGGLDMSIVYELDRGENVGNGMSSSIIDIRNFINPLFPLSDAIAMGVVHAVAGNGGPLIPFRAGRVDATGPGPAGVPQPHEDLATHTESFRKQGFNRSEMIELVACGHTFGGVRNPDFPDLVPNERDSKFFDTTNRVFDNNVVVEYINETTQNILVIAENATMASDLRIFNSDGNKTMTNLANAGPSNFATRCGDLFQRMIDTVPKSVTLTDPIQPAQFVLKKFITTILADNKISFAVTSRTLQPTARNNVTLFWSDAAGTCTKETCKALPVSFQDRGQPLWTNLMLVDVLKLTARFHNFNFTVPSGMLIEKFWLEVTDLGPDGALQTTVADNGGGGFVFPDRDIFFDRVRSTRKSDVNATVTSYVVAVRNGSTQPSRLYVEGFDGTSDFKSSPDIREFDFIPSTSISSMSGFTFYECQVRWTIHLFSIKAVKEGHTINVETGRDFLTH